MRKRNVHIQFWLDKKDVYKRQVLCSNSDSAITQYVNQNINKYFDVILKISNGTSCDEENVAVAVLNDTNLTTERKQHYISGLRTTITFI